jgi:predicted site-specific integrase-resolvase
MRGRGRGRVLEEGGRARVDEKRSFADTRRDSSVSHADARREPASKNYDEYPRRSGIFDAALIGYARVSTADQNPDHQIDALRRASVAAQDIYVDHASGAKASRPQLNTVLRILREGDTLKITRLDRLGRSVLHLVALGAELRERGVGLHVTEQGIDTTTAEGR